jgi:hypothetical protein
MGMFGWSYPPGCSGSPYDGLDYCEVCGNSVDDCVCPKCPICHEYGDPACYDETSEHFHGLVLDEEQKKAIEKNSVQEFDYDEPEPYDYDSDIDIFSEGC